ncbi:MAG: hypothetical protein U9P90_02330 [Patescibacteria group bacterium]|nr:hypothetical protein [Patescibacteria group bacterium]
MNFPFVNTEKILIVGSGSSVDLLPREFFLKIPIISINWSFVYIPEENLQHINFCSDFKNHAEQIKKRGFKVPPLVLTKYDFKQVYQYQISKDLTCIASSSNSTFRAIDLAYKLNPKKIYMIGIDLQGADGQKIKELKFLKRINYDLPEIKNIFENDVKEIELAKKRMCSEGMKLINLSPCSRIPQDEKIGEIKMDETMKPNYRPEGKPKEKISEKEPKLKTFGNTDSNGAEKNVKDLEKFGNPDAFKLICKASSEEEGWMKSTKAMEVQGIGCIVQVTTQQGDNIAEALTFVPGAKIKENFLVKKSFNKKNEIIGEENELISRKLISKHES